VSTLIVDAVFYFLGQERLVPNSDRLHRTGDRMLYPGLFCPDEARVRVLARTANILGELEVAVRRELGADRIPLRPAAPAGAQVQMAAPGRDYRSRRADTAPLLPPGSP